MKAKQKWIIFQPSPNSNAQRPALITYSNRPVALVFWPIIRSAWSSFWFWSSSCGLVAFCRLAFAEKSRNEIWTRLPNVMWERLHHRRTVCQPTRWIRTMRLLRSDYHSKVYDRLVKSSEIFLLISKESQRRTRIWRIWKIFTSKDRPPPSCPNSMRELLIDLI